MARKWYYSVSLSRPEQVVRHRLIGVALRRARHRGFVFEPEQGTVVQVAPCGPGGMVGYDLEKSPERCVLEGPVVQQALTTVRSVMASRQGVVCS